MYHQGSAKGDNFVISSELELESISSDGLRGIYFAVALSSKTLCITNMVKITFIRTTLVYPFSPGI